RRGYSLLAPTSHPPGRLPAISELAGIVDFGVSCGLSWDPFGAPCIDQPVFGPTFPGPYWSAATHITFPDVAWFVNFFDGVPFWYGKHVGSSVRTVRSGL